MFDYAWCTRPHIILSSYKNTLKTNTLDTSFDQKENYTLTSKSDSLKSNYLHNNSNNKDVYFDFITDILN